MAAFRLLLAAERVAASNLGCPRFRAKGNHLPACGQARPNIKGGLDDRAIARVAEQLSGASNHLWAPGEN